MSSSGKTVQTSPRKENTDRNVLTPKSKKAAAERVAPKIRPYEAPDEKTKRAIEALLRRNDYTGLDPAKLNGKPHPVTGDVTEPDLAAQITHGDTELQEAQETGILNPASHKEFSDDTYGHTARLGSIVYAITHDISDQIIRTHIIPHSDDIVQINSRTREIRDKLRRQKLNCQRAVGKLFLKVIKNARQHFVDVEFDLATVDRRDPIWEHIFRAAPFRTTRAMLGSCADVFDLENIFFNSHQDVIRIEWQDLFETMFKAGCEYCAVACPGDEDQNGPDQLQEFYKSWRGIPGSETWRGYGNLWTIQRAPINMGYITQGQTKKITKGETKKIAIAEDLGRILRKRQRIK